MTQFVTPAARERLETICAHQLHDIHSAKAALRFLRAAREAAARGLVSAFQEKSTGFDDAVVSAAMNVTRCVGRIRMAARGDDDFAYLIQSTLGIAEIQGSLAIVADQKGDVVEDLEILKRQIVNAEWVLELWVARSSSDNAIDEAIAQLRSGVKDRDSAEVVNRLLHIVQEGEAWRRDYRDGRNDPNSLLRYVIAIGDAVKVGLNLD